MRQTFDQEEGSHLGTISDGSNAVIKPPSVSQQAANLNREWWADQQARYFPLEDMANDMILDEETRRANRDHVLERVTNDIGASFERSENRLETVRSRGNQVQSQRSEKTSNRLNDIQKAATTVSARNAARQGMDETELQIIGG